MSKVGPGPRHPPLSTAGPQWRSGLSGSWTGLAGALEGPGGAEGSEGRWAAASRWLQGTLPPARSCFLLFGGDLCCHGNSIRAEHGASWHPKGQTPEQGLGSGQFRVPPARARPRPGPRPAPAPSGLRSLPQPGLRCFCVLPSLPVSCQQFGAAQVWGPAGIRGRARRTCQRRLWGERAEPEPQLGAVGEPPAQPHLLPEPRPVTGAGRCGAEPLRRLSRSHWAGEEDWVRTRSEATHGPSGGGDSVAGLRKSEGPTAGPARHRAPLGGEGPSTPGSSPGPGPSSSRPPRTGSACQNRRRRGSEAGIRPTRCRAPAGGSLGGLVPTSQAPGPPRLFSVPELGRQGLGRPASAGDRSCVPARTPPGHRRSQPERGPGLAGRWLDSLRPVGLGVAGGHPGMPLGVASFSREAQPCSPVGTSPAGPPCGSGRAADPGPGGGERRLC